MVTIVFSDLVESTKLADKLDTEVLREVLARYFEEMRLVLDEEIDLDAGIELQRSRIERSTGRTAAGS